MVQNNQTKSSIGKVYIAASFTVESFWGPCI